MKSAAESGIVHRRRASAGRQGRFVTAQRTGPTLSPAGRHWAEKGGQMAGKFFDEWQIGDRIEHQIRRTVPENDNLLFSTRTHTPHLLQLAADAARASEISQTLGRAKTANRETVGQ